MKKSDHAYLLHIQEAISLIREYTLEGREYFFHDSKTQDAVIRQLEIIGEATKNLKAQTKDLQPDIPWKQIAGMRDKMIHAYFGVDLHLVWDVVEKELASLDEAIKNLLMAAKS